MSRMFGPPVGAPNSCQGHSSIPTDLYCTACQLVGAIEVTRGCRGKIDRIKKQQMARYHIRAVREREMAKPRASSTKRAKRHHEDNPESRRRSKRTKSIATQPEPDVGGDMFGVVQRKSRAGAKRRRSSSSTSTSSTSSSTAQPPPPPSPFLQRLQQNARKNKESQAKFDRLKEKLLKAQKDNAHLKRDKTDLQKALTKLNEEFATAADFLDDANDEIKETDLALEEMTTKAVALQQTIDDQQDTIDKFNKIPIFKKVKNKNWGGNHEGQYPTQIWAFLSSCLSTKVSTSVLQNLLRKFQRFFLPWLTSKTFEVPGRTYLDHNRFTMGVCAEICASMAFAAAKKLHIGFDGTEVEKIHCESLYAVAKYPNGDSETVSLCAARPTTGSKSVQELAFIEQVFDDVMEKTLRVRDLLPPNQRQLVKVVGAKTGKATLGKSRSIMIDTCHQARKTQRLVAEKVDEAVKEIPNWHLLPLDEQMCIKELCAHHLRALWSDRYEKVSDRRLKEDLGEDAAQLDSNCRVELSLKSYLFALGKEICDEGLGLYAKSGIGALKPYVKEHHPNAVKDSGGTRIRGSRQDELPRMAFKTVTLIKVIAGYTAHMMAEGGAEQGNILRESVFVRGTNGRFICRWVVSALLFDLIFEPARKIMTCGYDYMALGPFYDNCYTLAKKMIADPNLLIDALKADQSSQLFLFDERWRTQEVQEWLEYRANRPAYNAGTRVKVPGSSIQKEVRAVILEHWNEPGWGVGSGNASDDSDSGGSSSSDSDQESDSDSEGQERRKKRGQEYTLSCYSEFGTCWKDSLEYSCSDILTEMGGMYCIGKQTPAMKKDGEDRKGDNNDGERSFAIVKALRKIFPTMHIQTLEGLALAAQNKTFDQKDEIAGTTDGWFFRQHEDVQEAIRIASNDDFYVQQRKDRIRLHDEAVARKAKADQAAKRKQLQERALKAQVAFGKATRITTKTALADALKDKNIGQQTVILKDQIRLRVLGYGFQGERGYDFKVLLGGSVAILKALMEKIIKVERTALGRKRWPTPETVYSGNIYRFKAPVLGAKTLLRKSIEKAIKMKGGDLIETEDDVELVAVIDKYVHKVFYDDDEVSQRYRDGREKAWGRTRKIMRVAWSNGNEGEDGSYQVLSHLCNDDGTEKQSGQRKLPEWYLVNDILDDMIVYHQTNLVHGIH